jgi:hypothetical protein
MKHKRGKYVRMVKNKSRYKVKQDALKNLTPITVNAGPKTRNAFARLNNVIVGPNPIRGMAVCPHLLYDYVVLCR